MIVEFAKINPAGGASVTEASYQYPFPSVGGLRGDTFTTTIASGTTTSTSGTVVSIPTGYRIATVVTPSGWTAGNIQFQGSDDGVTFGDSYDQYGTKITVTPVAGARSTLEPITGLLIATPRYLKLVSTVTQTNTVNITLVTVSI